MNILKQPRLAAAALAASVLLVAGPAGAQQQPIMAFTTANVVDALSALGVTNAKAQRSAGQGGAPIDYVGFSVGEVRHIAVLEVCNAGAAGCLGLSLLTIWSDAGSVVDRNRLNEFNATYSFGKGFVAGDSLIFQRYAISDGGVSKRYIQSNITNFIGSGQRFQEFVGGSPTTVSASPGDAKLAKAALTPAEEAAIAALSKEFPNKWNAAVTATALEAEHLK